MNCWICGEYANSGEHVFKASVLKLINPNTSQSNPITHKKDNSDNFKNVGSVKNKIFHFSAKICSTCNNVRTSNHDKSWAILSEYLFSKKGLRELSLIEVWGGSYEQHMLNVHLFFAKLLGCAIESSHIEKQSINLSTKSLAKCIVEDCGNPNLLLSFHYIDKAILSGVSDLEAHINPSNGDVTYCIFFYIIGNYAVKIAHSNFEKMYVGMNEVWHPHHNVKGINTIKLLPFN